MVTFFTNSESYRSSSDVHKPIYHEATKYVSSLVGHECLLEDSALREANYWEALAYVNSFCDLGLEKEDVDLFSLYFTALSDSRRFGSDKSMPLQKGENPATHSLQAICLKQRMFDDAAQAIQSNPPVKPFRQEPMSRMQGIQLKHSQMTGLGLLMHDMGEVLGEFTSLSQRIENTDLQEDPAAERTIFTYVLRLALQSQTTEDRAGFYRRVEELKQQVKLQKADGSASGIPKSSEHLEKFMQPPITLSPEQEARYEKLTALWDMAEGFSHPLHAEWEAQGVNVGFVHQLTKSIDHVQGTRHLVRMARNGSIAETPNYGEDVSDIAHWDKNRVKGNVTYCEPEAGPMVASLKQGQYGLEIVARQQLASLYRTMSDVMDVAPPPALGYHIASKHSAYVAPNEPLEEPENPSIAEQKRAQGALRGLYERAANAALRGHFSPHMVDDGKGGKRSQFLGIDGITREQQAALYEGKTTSLGHNVG